MFSQVLCHVIKFHKSKIDLTVPCECYNAVAKSFLMVDAIKCYYNVMLLTRTYVQHLF